MAYFKDCLTAEDVKKEYFEHCKALHPDNGGNAAEFVAMKNAYKAAFAKLKDIHANKAGETYTAKETTTETAEAFADIIEKIIFLAGIRIEICGCFVWITGNTYAVKEELKKHGFKFSKNKTAWYYTPKAYHKRSRRAVSLDEIRDLFGTEDVETKAAPALM